MEGPVFSSFQPGGIKWPGPPKQRFWRLDFPSAGAKQYTSMENFVFRPDMFVDPKHHNSNSQFKLKLPGLKWVEDCKVRRC